MNKGFLAIIAVGVLLLIGGIFITTSSDSNSELSSIQTNQVDTEQTNSSELPAQSDRYITADSNEISTITAGKRVLFFHASWCPTCHALDSDIRAHSALIPEDLRIVKVDFDKETALRKKYGVTLQHTLVQIDKNGDEIAQWNGSPNLKSLLGQVL